MRVCVQGAYVCVYFIYKRCLQCIDVGWGGVTLLGRGGDDDDCESAQS